MAFCASPSHRRDHEILFTTGPELGHPSLVRTLALTSLLILSVLANAHGQDQEKKLIDRLLKPDMELRNGAQDKKFMADGASINKRATVGTFYIQEKPKQKNFYATGEFATQQFNSQPFHSKRSMFRVSSQQTMATSRSGYATQAARGVRDAPQSSKKVSTREYAENRPFQDEGKSQKSLNRQNAPLTIEQVRELLNKNK
jgi:hypothetical protein